jgi:hypothetical protein
MELTHIIDKLFILILAIYNIYIKIFFFTFQASSIKVKFTTPHLQQNNLTHFYWDTRTAMVLITKQQMELKNFLSYKYHIALSQSYILCQLGTG